MAVFWIRSLTKSWLGWFSWLSPMLVKYLPLSLASLCPGSVRDAKRLILMLLFPETFSSSMPGFTSGTCQWSHLSHGQNILTPPSPLPPFNLQQSGEELFPICILIRSNNWKGNTSSKVNTALQFLLVAVSLGAPILHYQVILTDLRLVISYH